jgi:dehydrogenase/reductase SDR family member 12
MATGRGAPGAVARVVDAAIELPVVPSFTRIGYDVRSRLEGWRPLDDYDLTGRVIVLTGATSGLGRAAADRFAAARATLVLVGRDEGRVGRVRDELAATSGNDDVTVAVADLSDLDAVRSAAEAIAAAHERIDVLIHNAGALSATRTETDAGHETTVAAQVLGPFLLTGLLIDRLRAAAPGRVLTMSSGGMYATGLTVSRLEMAPEEYRGAEQYARAKRAQVTLNELWADRVGPTEVVFHALHPGWADTPGVAESLPTFRRVVGPLLRSADQGADTLVWLAADDDRPLASSGDFWLDRRVRPIHRLPTTARTDTVERRAELWRWCVDRTGVDPA